MRRLRAVESGEEPSGSAVVKATGPRSLSSGDEQEEARPGDQEVHVTFTVTREVAEELVELLASNAPELTPEQVALLRRVFRQE